MNAIRFASIAIATAILVSCGADHPFKRGNPVASISSKLGLNSSTSGATAFGTEVYPIVSANCTRCHGWAKGSEDAVREKLLSYISKDDPEKSHILQKLSGTTSHSGGALFPKETEEYEKFKNWILSEANGPEVAPTPPVVSEPTPEEPIVEEPTTPSQDSETNFHWFETTIYPIVSNNCIGCHSFAEKTSDQMREKLLSYISKDDPEKSRILQKLSGTTSHGGGALFPKETEEYEKFKNWILMEVNHPTSPSKPEPEPKDKKEKSHKTGASVFENDVYPIISETCAMCHAEFRSQSPSQMRAGLMPFTYTDSINKSYLLKKISGKVSHGGGALFSEDSPEYEKIKNWMLTEIEHNRK